MPLNYAHVKIYRLSEVSTSMVQCLTNLEVGITCRYSATVSPPY